MKRLGRKQIAKGAALGLICLVLGFTLHTAEVRKTTVDVRTPALLVQPLTERPPTETGPPTPGRRDAVLEPQLQRKIPLDIPSTRKSNVRAPLSSTSYVYFAGWSDVVRNFLNRGGDSNHRIDGGRTETLLQHAAILGDVELTALIINKGAEPNERNDLGNTALHFAAYYARPEIVELLISKGANVNAKNNHGETPLHLATKESSEEKWLQPRLQASLSQETQTLVKRSPRRITEGHVSVARALLRHGAKVDAMSYIGLTPDTAAKRRCKAISKPMPDFKEQWNLEVSLCNELLQALRGDPAKRRGTAGF